VFDGDSFPEVPGSVEKEGEPEKRQTATAASKFSLAVKSFFLIHVHRTFHLVCQNLSSLHIFNNNK
jgi:hypothetical protein